MNVMKTSAASAGGDETSEAEDKDSYTVGWICALPLEMAAAELMLDEIYDDVQFEQDDGDHNSYTLGLMQGHRVVIACLPNGVYGTNPAATVAKDMLRTFKSIRFGLLVGIGGGAPSSDHDIRLGDIVVSTPSNTSGGVIQHDRGKKRKFEEFERTGSLNAPPKALLTALSRLQARHLRGASKTPGFLSGAVEKIEKASFRQKYAYQGESNDRLFRTEYEHVNAGSSCNDCDNSQTVERIDRDGADPVVHYGNIASGNQVVKHSETRDRLSKELGVICFEMEAAGLMQDFPCLVIRGICDYSDSHKNKIWQDYAAATAAAYAKDLLSRVLPSNVKKEKVIAFDPRLYALLVETKEAISHQTQQQERRYEYGKSAECLRELFQTNPKDDRERIMRRNDSTPTLFRSSYEWILNVEEFQRWRTDPECRRLWIRGDPGKGKTMLLCGIIEELEKSDSRPLCYFFCQATVPALDNATSVLRSLILQLAQKYPWLRNQVLAVYENGGKARFNDHNAWSTMYELLNSMLSDPQLDDVLLIVDALDECTTDRLKLLQFIKNLSTISRAKVIISSRKWTLIGEVLGEDDANGSTITLESHDDLIANAVHSYIDREVEQLASRKKFNKEICSKVREYLRRHSQDTFLWVSLVCQALLDGSVKKRNVMKVLETYPPGLNAFYERMISSLPSLDEDLYKEILSVMSILKRPVTVEELLPLLHSHLLDDTESLEEAIESCGFFLNIQEEMIYFVHQSAVEFLKSSAAKLSTIAERHKSVFWSSMDVLSRPGKLKRDIYGLKEPSTGVTEIRIPKPNPLSALQYLCTYWVDHLTDWVCEERTAMGKPMPQEDYVISKINVFLRRRFLNWIEALSLLRQMQEAAQAIQKLQILFNQNHNSIEQGLSSFIHDANRFLLHHRVVIENTPLQLYASALLFSPEQSVVKKQFRDEAPDWVTITPGLEKTWGACLQTLEGDMGRQNGATTVAYSPDGEWLVTRYADGTVKLWHAKSGTCTHTVSVHGEEDRPSSVQMVSHESKSVAFSADGKSFVSSSWNGVVKVWDRDSGRCTHQLEPYTTNATVVAISSDGSTAAWFASSRIIIRSTKGEIPAHTVEYHSEGHIYSVALNADGHWIATGSRDGLLEFFNVSTGDGQQISTDDKIFTVAWSPDGAWVASGGDSVAEMCSIVQIWERRTGKSIRRIKYEIPNNSGPQDIPKFMEFSADKKFLAAGCRFNICVWNTSTGALTWAICGSNISDINSISFSPDTQQIVSASCPSTIKVWDLSMIGEAVSPSPNDRARQLTFADEDHFLAYYTGNTKRIRLWGRRADIPESRFYTKYASAIALSRDKQQLASASGSETTITIWNTSTRAITMEVCGRTEHICFDARDSEDSVCQPRLWDKEVYDDDYGRRTLSGGIDSLAFGHASQLFSSLGGLIKIWNTSNGSCSQTIVSGRSRVTNITVSSQGQRFACLASGIDTSALKYRNAIIQIWDIASNQCISTLSTEQNSSYNIRSLSFSVDMQQLAISTSIIDTPTASHRAVICLWDLRSGSLTRMFTSDKIEFIEARFDTEVKNRLHTEYGFFGTHEFLGKSSSGPSYADSSILREDFEHTPVLERSEAMPSFRGYGLSCDREWIVRDGKRWLWIPPDFRPSSSSGDISPGMDGSSIVWLRDIREPVRMYFKK